MQFFFPNYRQERSNITILKNLIETILPPKESSNGGFCACIDFYVQNEPYRLLVDRENNPLFADKEKIIANAKKQEQSFLIQQFIHALTKYDRPLTEWEESMWQMTVDTATVQPDGKLLFRFQGGTVLEGYPIDAVFLSTL